MFRCCFCCPAMHACSDGQFSAPIDSQQQSFQLCDYFNYATMIRGSSVFGCYWLRFIAQPHSGTPDEPGCMHASSLTSWQLYPARSACLQVHRGTKPPLLQSIETSQQLHTACSRPHGEAHTAPAASAVALCTYIQQPYPNQQRFTKLHTLCHFSLQSASASHHSPCPCLPNRQSTHNQTPTARSLRMATAM